MLPVVFVLVVPPAAVAGPAPTPTPSPHTITVINRCSQQIWLGANGQPAFTSPSLALAPRCTSENAATVCNSGTCDRGSCTCTPGTSDCDFNAPAGTTTAACVNGRCQTRVRFSVPATWNGRIWGRTGCSGSTTDFSCASGQCGLPPNAQMDCQAQNAFGSLATLFELDAVSPGSDNFDVSLVSGYNVPMTVKVMLPPDAPTWKPTTFYASGATIVERTKQGYFGFTNADSGGVSGTTRPTFPFKDQRTVQDAPGVTWQNTAPRCAESGCTRAGLSQDECPTQLQAAPNGTYAACNVPSAVCSPSDLTCSLFQCLNGRDNAPTDAFGNLIGLPSPNGASAVCYSPADCAPGSHCLLNPAFQSGVAMPSGTGVCMPVAQDGGCTVNNTADGDPCPDIYFPYPNATCQTFSGKADGKRVCLASLDYGNGGLGNLWWNAESWSAVVPTKSCSADTDCATGDHCIEEGAQQSGLKECADTGTCKCFTPKTCATGDDCPTTGKACLDSTGAACSGGTCYCSPQAMYSGTCGATNQEWINAATSINDPPGATWPQGFRAACPVAYGYSFDDPASNWFCPNGTAGGANGYRIIFCGPNVE